MRRKFWIILGLLIGLIALGTYLTSTASVFDSIERMGDDESTLTLKDWLSFGGMVLGFGTAIANLIKSIFDARTAANRSN